MLRSITILSFLLLACQPKSEQQVSRNEDSHQVTDDSLKESDQKREPDERMSWQKPQQVIQALGDISNKTIADLGAGLGYFSFKLLPKAAGVIAIDIDDDIIQILGGFKNSLSPSQKEKFQIRLASETRPNLKQNEVDIIFIVNTVSFLQPRVEYLSNLKPYLKPGGEIFIVDYKSKRLPNFVPAPDYDHRVYMHILEEELEQAGFIDIKTNDLDLAYQYITTAKLP